MKTKYLFIFTIYIFLSFNGFLCFECDESLHTCDQGIPNIVVFGKLGVGKSKFLNCITDGCSSNYFNTKFQMNSVTREVKGKISTISGTKFVVKVFDTPGIGAGDEDLTEWIETFKNIPENFDALVWIVNINERVSYMEMIIFKTLMQLIKDFNLKRLIIVFNRCNQIEEKVDLDEIGNEFIRTTTINKGKNIEFMFHGLKTTEFFYADNFNNKLVDVLKEIIYSKNLKKLSLNTDVNVKSIISDSIQILDKDSANYIQELETTKDELKKQIEHNQLSAQQFKEVMQSHERIVGQLLEQNRALMRQNRRCFSEFSKILLVRNNTVIQTQVGEIKTGDIVITARPLKDRLELNLEPVIIKSESPVFSDDVTLPFIVVMLSNNKKIIIHLYHFMNIEREGQIYHILAKDVKKGDVFFTLDNPHFEQIFNPKLIEYEKAVVIRIELAKSEDIGRPMNIRTISNNLLLNDIWSSSYFYGDGGYFVHQFIIFCSKIHSKLGQLIYNIFQVCGLQDLHYYIFN